nr:hypothetical protein [Pantoea cypripedii]
MSITVRVWYTEADGSIAGVMPVEISYDLDLNTATAAEDKYNMVSNAVSDDDSLLGKANVTWQLI